MWLRGLIVATVLVPTTSFSQNDSFSRAMKEIQREVKEDDEGAKGQRARELCNRWLNIKGPTRDAKDVARNYGSDVAGRWMECMVETMYPLVKP